MEGIPKIIDHWKATHTTTITSVQALEGGYVNKVYAVKYSQQVQPQNEEVIVRMRVDEEDDTDDVDEVLAEYHKVCHHTVCLLKIDHY